VSRWAWIEVDLEAVSENVRILRRVCGRDVWAVVKAGGYGHGAVEAAEAALRGGAAGLCVALVQEGVALRRAGISAPILVVSAQPAEELAAAIAHQLQLTVYSLDHVLDLAAAGGREIPVHLKFDTGMHRVGARPELLAELAAAVDASPAAQLVGVFTHMAIADEPDDPYNAAQLDRFDAILAQLDRTGGRPPMVHAANSAAALALPRSRYTMVRAGIAVYGLPPGPDVAHLCGDLRPALSVHARVAHVKRMAAGERVSYGLRHTFHRDANAATVPIGYADGVPRRLHANGGAVLIGGRRRPIVGVVTMDQLVVECGDDPVAVGDPVVLIGSQGDEEITATEWADLLGTINYEIVCGLSWRLDRRYRGG
jgi:alanine racemase